MMIRIIILYLLLISKGLSAIAQTLPPSTTNTLPSDEFYRRLFVSKPSAADRYLDQHSKELIDFARSNGINLVNAAAIAYNSLSKDDKIDNKFSYLAVGCVALILSLKGRPTQGVNFYESEYADIYTKRFIVDVINALENNKIHILRLPGSETQESQLAKAAYDPLYNTLYVSGSILTSLSDPLFYFNIIHELVGHAGEDAERLCLTRDSSEQTGFIVAGAYFLYRHPQLKTMTFTSQDSREESLKQEFSRICTSESTKSAIVKCNTDLALYAANYLLAKMSNSKETQEIARRNFISKQIETYLLTFLLLDKKMKTEEEFVLNSLREASTIILDILGEALGKDLAKLEITEQIKSLRSIDRKTISSRLINRLKQIEKQAKSAKSNINHFYQLHRADDCLQTRHSSNTNKNPYESREQLVSLISNHIELATLHFALSQFEKKLSIIYSWGTQEFNNNSLADMLMGLIDIDKGFDWKDYDKEVMSPMIQFRPYSRHHEQDDGIK